ncbi:MAG: 3'-5' exoribonuclease YhaM family protein [Longimicrobiales bacterium]
MAEARNGRPTARQWIADGAFPWPSVQDVPEGELIVGCYSIATVQLGTTRHDKPYLRLQLCDRHGMVEARVWDDAETLASELGIGSFVGVRARIERFNESRQLRIETVELLHLADDELELFMPRSARDHASMERELEERLASIGDAGFLRLLRRVLDRKRETGRAFRYAPAAKYNHHAYVGGLLEHTLSVVGVCQRLAEHYGARLDRDLLVTGALLHDIGKIREIGLEPGFPYTDEGKLLGHILIGLELVRDAARDLPNLSADRLNLLLHLIASHQGRYEWQSPREPRTLEAIALHYADDLDAKMQQALELTEKVEGGWTPYDRSLGRELYRHRTRAGIDVPGAPPSRLPDTLDLFSGD